MGSDARLAAARTALGPAGSADALVRGLTGALPGRRCPACGAETHGRPVLPGWEVSVAHAPGIDIVAVARGVRVGVDVEQVGSARDAIRTMLVHPDETVADADLTRWWVRKAAALKASGEGLRREPATLLLSEGADGWTVAWPDGTVASGRDVDAGPGYLAAVCAL